MTRTFVAIVPPDEVREVIARRVARFESDSSVRWVDPALYHFTLRFFGDVDDDTLVRIQEITAQVALLGDPFPARLGAAGTFPPKGRPRVFWVGLSRGAREMAELGETLERAYQGAGLGAADKPMRPHVTVGRAKVQRGRKSAKPQRRMDFRDLTFDGPDFTVRSIAVVGSELTPQGPVYTPLAEVLLGA